MRARCKQFMQVLFVVVAFNAMIVLWLMQI